MNLNTGDKIAFINDPLRGMVVKRLDKNKVLVVLEDGFEIPANISELVLVERNPAYASAAESGREERFLSDNIATEAQGIYMGCTTDGNRLTKPEVKGYIINTTTADILFSLFRSHSGKTKGVARGLIESGEAMQVMNFPLDQADEYRNWQVQILHFEKEVNAALPPWTLSFKIRPAALLKDKQAIPIVAKEGLLLKLEPQQEETSGRMIYKPDPDLNPFTFVEQVGEVVDLHIEELLPNVGSISMTPEQIMTTQIGFFRNALEKAQAFGMKKVTFIHGIGNGRLKTEIRKQLATDRFIERFEDADPKKFGYGATSVYLKSI